MPGDTLLEAKDALVFLVVAQKCRWKIPVGYFLTNGLNTEEKANWVKGCLIMMNNIGVAATS